MRHPPAVPLFRSPTFAFEPYRPQAGDSEGRSPRAAEAGDDLAAAARALSGAAAMLLERAAAVGFLAWGGDRYAFQRLARAQFLVDARLREPPALESTATPLR